MFEQFNFHVNFYQINQEQNILAKSKHLVYFHGFSMHDKNYELCEQMEQEGLISFITCNFEQGMQLVKNYRTDIQYTDIKYFVSISVNYHASDLSYTQVQDLISNLVINQATRFIGFSYGCLFASTLVNDCIKIAKDITLKNLDAIAIHGSLTPVSDEVSIPVAIAQATASKWSKEVCLQFLNSIGAFKFQDLETVKQQLETTNDIVFTRQKDFLNYLNQKNTIELFRIIYSNQTNASLFKWALISQRDVIFPSTNLTNLYKSLNVSIDYDKFAHVLNPQQMLKVICEYARR